MNSFLQLSTAINEEQSIILNAKDVLKLIAFEFAIHNPMKPESTWNEDVIKNDLLILMTGPLDGVKIRIAALLSDHAKRTLKILDGRVPEKLPAAAGDWEVLLERAKENHEIIFIKNAPLLFGRVPSERTIKINLKRVLGMVKYYQVPVIASGISVGQFCSSFTNSSVGSIQIGQ